MKRKPKVHTDPMSGHKSPPAGSGTHHKRGKTGLKHKIKGNKVHTFGENAKNKFKHKAKASEADNVGRHVRPAAHNPRQAKVANRAKRAVERLSEKVI